MEKDGHRSNGSSCRGGPLTDGTLGNIYRCQWYIFKLAGYLSDTMNTMIATVAMVLLCLPSTSTAQCVLQGNI